MTGKSQRTAAGKPQYWLVSACMFFLLPCMHGQKQESQTPYFRVNVDTVFVKVVVTDSLNRSVTGLQKEDFKVYEDNIQQTILHFGQQSAPVSVGFIFDRSGSMRYDHRYIVGRNWFNQLVKTGETNPDDEYFLITFNQKIDLVRSFTDEPSGFAFDVILQKPGGWTALFDAVYRGIDMVQEGKNEKKALIVITDGEENRSRYRWNELRELAMESDVQIYAIGVDPSGYALLKSLAGLTGGRAFLPDAAGIDYYINLIHTELRNQYLLGYVPINTRRDGKWRQITVKLDTPRGFPKLLVRTRNGYYAPRD